MSLPFRLATAPPLKNVLIALSIDRWVIDPTDRAGRSLNSLPLVFVGLISYTIYLWQ